MVLGQNAWRTPYNQKAEQLLDCAQYPCECAHIDCVNTSTLEEAKAEQITETPSSSNATAAPTAHAEPPSLAGACDNHGTLAKAVVLQHFNF